MTIDWNQGDSGLPSKFVGTIDNAFFALDPDYREGEVPQLHLDILSADPDTEDQMDARWGVGKGWEVVDGGRSVVREDGRPRNFHANTIMFNAIKALAESGVDINALVKARGETPSSAGFWNGLTCFWDVVDINYGGEIGIVQKLLPVKLVGDKAAAKLSKPELDSNIKNASKGYESPEALRKAIYAQFPDVMDHDDLIEKIESDQYWSE